MIATLFVCDFKERIRKPSFLMLAGVILIASFFFVPNANDSFRTLIISSEKFIQADNPTWIPIATGIIAGTFLPIVGFSFCLGSIKHERNSGIYFSLVAQGMNKLRYVIGKFVSHFLILASMLGIMAVGSFIMMNVRFFLQPITFWTFISPFLVVIPSLVFVSAIAVLLESVPFFKNALPFCVVIFFVFHIITIVNGLSSAENFSLIFDTSGLAWFSDIIKNSAGENATITILGGGGWISTSGTQQLVFSGLPLTSNRLLQKLLLIVISMLMLFPAAICLETRQPTKSKGSEKSASETLPTEKTVSINKAPYISVACGRGAFLTLLLCELKHAVKQLPPLWFVIEAGLFIASIFAPVHSVYTAIIPIMYGVAVLPFSRLGTIEHLSGMDNVLLATNKAYIRKTLSEGLVAVAFSIALASVALIRGFALLGVESAISFLLFAVLSPLVALLLGRLCKTSRVFELLYLLLCYVMLNAPGLIIRI